MKQLWLGVIGILLMLPSCNNDLKSIGQDLVGNGNHIGEENIRINTVATVRVDSFITSQGIYAQGNINSLIMGKYATMRDGDTLGGLTRAIPCFQIAPQSEPSVSPHAVLDSVTFEFFFNGKFWGDSTYNPQVQKFDLYQLKKVPELDYDHNGIFYNTSPLELDSVIGSVAFLPKRQPMGNARFRIKDGIARYLFEKMWNKEEPNIYEPGNGAIYFSKFIHFFKGLAIVPHEENNCLIGIKAQPDSLYMKFYYRENNTERAVLLKLAQREYQFNQILTSRTNTEFKDLHTQEDEVYFRDTELAIAQGLTGYMLKMSLPHPPGFDAYTTIIKAQIEMPVKYVKWSEIPFPTQLGVYKTDKQNEVLGALMNNEQTPVTGYLEINNMVPGASRYLFDVTEYYQTMAARPLPAEEQEVLIAVPNLTLSYDYVILEEEPRVRFYYANYKQ